jgi:hypothetical protein
LILSGIFLYIMEKLESKTVEYIYQETEIHFLLGNGNNVMVNATEMAKVFEKLPADFLRLDSTKNYIKSFLKKRNSKLYYGISHNISENIGADMPRYTEEDVVFSKQKSGTYMIRPLALKFASWLDSDFEVWVFDTIDDLLFGNYKKHWDAHVKQEDAKVLMEETKSRLLLNPTQADVIAYFKAENEFKSAKSDKQKAISSQYRLFEQS